MKDYAFFVPTALKGKNVVLEGNAERKVISVNEQKHYAEDAKNLSLKLMPLHNRKKKSDL
jgi:hypothetical protein